MGDDEFGHRGKCAIVGIGETDISRNSCRSDLTMATQAALAAIADAGLKPSDIDGLVRCDMDTVSPYAMADSLGLSNLTYWSDVPRGGAAAAAMVGQAAAAVIGHGHSCAGFSELNGAERAAAGPVVMDSGKAGGSAPMRSTSLPMAWSPPVSSSP